MSQDFSLSKVLSFWITTCLAVFFYLFVGSSDLASKTMSILSVIRHLSIPLQLSVAMFFIPYTESVGTAMQKKKACSNVFINPFRENNALAHAKLSSEIKVNVILALVFNKVVVMVTVYTNGSLSVLACRFFFFKRRYSMCF